MTENGILSITDPRGRYMGMQTLARRFLGRGYDAVDIDISCIGSEENPVAVVLALNSVIDNDQKNPPITYIKGDYFVNATDELFGTMLSKALTRRRADELIYKGSTNYYIYFNSGLCRKVTKEEFYSEECSFGSTYCTFGYLDSLSDDRLRAITDLTLANNLASTCDLRGLFRRMPGLKRVDLSDIDFTDVCCRQDMFKDCKALEKVILSETILSAECKTEPYTDYRYGKNMFMDGDGILHRHEEYTAPSDRNMSFCVSDARSRDTFSFAAEPQSAWLDYLGLSSGAVIITNEGIPLKPTGTKHTPAAPDAPAQRSAPAQRRPGFCTPAPTPQKPAGTKHTPASSVDTVAPGSKGIDSISPEKWRALEETARKRRRGRLIGTAIGVGVSILLYLIAYKLLG